MIARRVIACLDVRDGVVVKGVRFRDHEIVGEIEGLATRYRDAGVDELVFYDIAASPAERGADVRWVERLARVLDVPFCVAGGIRSVAQAERLLAAGADKISVNSPALERPELIDELAARFGVQCVVVGIDSRAVDGAYRVHQYTGDAARSRALARDTLAWVREAQSRGAGEIVLNCMDSDGVRRGYDVPQLRAARTVCAVPLIASGGAGCADDFLAVFAQADVDGALAASVFHRGVLEIGALKSYLRTQGVAIRPEWHA
jgi:cyclase